MSDSQRSSPFHDSAAKLDLLVIDPEPIALAWPCLGVEKLTQSNLSGGLHSKGSTQRVQAPSCILHA